MMELLAPAGDEAALRAAVCAGADAVYLGLQRFGARASAANFTPEALEKAVAYAHLHHVRVYVAVNTLVKQAELPAAFDALQTVAACRADAAIVQDMGVLRIAREAFPALALHASTQVSLHTAGGARWAATHGVSRVVLARECPLAAVRAVTQTGVAAEVFTHGALCASVSGQCLLSSMAGGRSGNRGRCAQPCRQAVAFGGESAAFLSMKDLCLRDHLPALAAAEVTALKIEGRLKRPEYVAVVTGLYRRALDNLARGAFRPADARERNELLQIFHRGGFTKGYLMGAEDAALCATARVGHGGLSVGQVTAVRGGLATVRLTLPLNDGDSLRVDSRTDVELRYAGRVEAQAATLRLRPGEAVRAGDAVYRTADAAQIVQAQALTEKPIPVTLAAVLRAGEPMRLTACDGGTSVTVTGETAQTPLNRPLRAEDIARQLGKLGDTPFVLHGDAQVDAGEVFAPVSALNALRREALDRLTQARVMAFYGAAREEVHLAALVAHPQTPTAYGALQPPDPAPATQALNLVKTVAARFPDPAMGQDLAAAGANLLLYAPVDLRADALAAALTCLPHGAWLALPPQVSDAAFADIRPLLLARDCRLGGVALGSVGQLGFDIPLPVALGEGVPILNREAARELLAPEIAFSVLWPEMSREDMDALAPQGWPTLLPVYGRERVMLLNHCPERVRRGLASGRAACALCGPNDRACASPDAALTDRMGYRFPMTRTRTAEGCVVAVHNALPTDLAKHDARRRQLGAGMLLRFTVETAAEAVSITRRFARLSDTGVAEPSATQATAGHFLRGVE
jgi:putative protease